MNRAAAAVGQAGRLPHYAAVHGKIGILAHQALPPLERFSVLACLSSHASCSGSSLIVKVVMAAR